MAWKNTAEAKATVLDLTIKNMAKNEGKIPTQLLEPVNNIIMISSDIESLKANQKANLKPLLHQASGLIIVLWGLYMNDRYPSIWPPPTLSRTVDKFVKTVDRIRKLTARKCEKTFVKKKIFAILDVRKVKQYLCKLDAVATNIEGNPRHVVDLNAVLQAAVNQYDNPQDEEAQILKAIVPEGSREQEAVNLSLPEVVEENEEDHEVETSIRSRASKEDLNASFNNIGPIEDNHRDDVETSTQASRETPSSQSSPPSPHWLGQHVNTFLNNSSGVMINNNVGNSFKTTIMNVGNNNSVNHYYTR